MPIFDNELLSNQSDRTYNKSNIDIGSSGEAFKEIDSRIGMGIPGQFEQPFQGITADQARNFKGGFVPMNVNSPFSMVSKSELLANQRYPLYERGINLENVYGLQQSGLAQLGNGLVKMGAFALGTFGQSFATIPNTMMTLKNLDMTELSNPDGYESSIDTWMRNLEDRFPNYVTDYEKSRGLATAIPFTYGSANFWGDKILKNSGFMVGAITGAIAQDAIIGAVTKGVGAVPLVAVQLGKASLYLNKLFAGANKVDRVLDLARAAGKTEQTLLNIERLGQLAAATKLTNGFRYGMSVYGSARTEAAIEARESYRTIKEQLTEQYKLENFGEEPTPEAIQQIEEYATDAMNTRFGINMALLTVSNAVQFDNIFKSFTGAQKGVTSSTLSDFGSAGKVGLKEGTLDTFEKKVPQAFSSKAWEFVKPRAINIFTEGVYEEGGQFAAQIGVEDYYTRKYNNKESWDFVKEAMTSTTKGLAEQFGSSAGIESMVIGAITAAITGPIVNKVTGKSKADNQRLNTTLNILNQYGMTGVLSNKYEDTSRSVEIARQMNDAVKSGNIFKFKNLKSDMFFGFVNSRIPIGMHDVTIEQLEMLKDLPKEEFEKTFGMDFSSSNKTTVNAYVDALIEKANNINDISTSINSTFNNPYNRIIDPKTDDEKTEALKYSMFENWKTDLTYLSYIQQDSNERLQDIQTSISQINPLLTNDLLKLTTSEKGLKELSDSYEQKANILSESLANLSPAERTAKRNEIKKLRTLSEKISIALNSNNIDPKLFNELINFELVGQDFSQPNALRIDETSGLREYAEDLNKIEARKEAAAIKFDDLSSEKGFDKYFAQEEELQKEKEEEAQQSLFPEDEKFGFLNKSGKKETLEVGREYQVPGFSPAKVRKAGEQFKVTSPTGEVTYYDTREEAKQAADDLNVDFSELTTVKVIGLNEDGTVKVEDLAGNIQNINLSALKGYEKLQTEEEKLAKDKKDIDKQLDEILQGSGTIATTSSSERIIGSEDQRKDASRIFTSTYSPSEDDAPAHINNLPHVKRARKFLNSFKFFKDRSDYRVIIVTPNNVKELGLEGIIQMSFDKPLTDALTDVETNVENGFMAQVFVIQTPEGDFFVNEKGEKISKVGDENPNILNDIIFQTMSSSSLTTVGGKTKVRAGQEDEAERALEAYKLFRQEMFNKKGYDTYSFSISRGIPRQNKINGQRENNPVSGILGPKADTLISEHKGLIKVITTGKIDHDGEILSAPVGSVMIQFGDLLDYVNNRKLNNKQASVIFKMLEELADNLVKTSKLDSRYTTYLRNVLYWNTKQGIKSPNQIGIDTNNMTLTIGGKAFPISQITQNKQQIMDVLSEAFISVNNKTLSEDFEKSFTDYKLDKNGNLISVIWKNYQTFLLSDKNPDGSKRNIDDIPLITHTAPETDAQSSYKQKYAYITDKDLLPYEKVPVKEKAQPTGSFINLPQGPIEYTIDAQGEIVISDNATIAELSTTLASAIDKKLRSFPKDVVTIDLDKSTNEDKAKYFAMLAVESSLAKSSQDPRIEEINKQFETKKKEALEQIKVNSATIKKGQKVFNEKGTSYKVVSISPLVIEDEFFGEKLDADKAYSQDPRTIISQLEQQRQQEINNLSQQAPAPSPQAPVADTAPKANIGFDPSEIFGNDEDQVDESDIFFDDNPELYRRVGEEEKVSDRMSASDFQEFIEWHKKNVPFIPFEVLERMIKTHDGKEAWGVFENGVAKFVKGGLRGTEYHEVFEAIWADFLTEAEKEQIINEFRNRKGQFTDRQSGKKFDYSDMSVSDKTIKERIADDFADFRLGKLPARTLSEKIRKFFKQIMDFFKSFVTKPSLKEELFKQIDKGRFKETKLSGKSYAPQYRAVEGLSEQLTNEFVQDMVIKIRMIIFGTGQVDLLFNPEKMTGEQILSKLRDAYESSNIISKIGENRYNQLVFRAIQFLRTTGININIDEVVSINDENKNSKEYAQDPFSTDWKSYSSGALKFMLSTMVERKPKNQIKVKKGKELQRPEENKSANLRGFKVINFNRVFATLLDRLHNTNDVNVFADKLLQLAKEDSNYIDLYRMLGGNLITHSIDFHTFSPAQWRLFIQFFNTFSRQKPNALIQYTSEEGEIYTGSANLFTTINETVNTWVNNMKIIGKSSTGIIVYNKVDKIYKIKTNEIKKLTIKKSNDQLSFLNQLGIEFDQGTYDGLSDKEAIIEGKITTEVKQFTDAVQRIYTQLGTNNDLMTFDTKRLEINGPLRTLASLYTKVNNPNQESTYFGVEGQRIGSFSENNAPSYFENDFNESKTLDELLEKRPQLKDVFSKGSEILKKGGLFFDKEGKRIAEIKVEYIQGSKNQTTGKDSSTSRLGLADRFMQEINQNINGKYYVLIPGDSSTEWMMNLGNVISMEDVLEDRYASKVNSIFNNYLIDEINLALKNRKQNLFTQNNASQLRFMRDILPENIVSEIEKRILDEQSIDEIQEYISKNREKINSSFQEFTNNTSQELFNLLQDNNRIISYEKNGETLYSIIGLDSTFANKYNLNNNLSFKEVMNFLKFVNINYEINNIEYHKFIFGDPYQFKIKSGNLDETKRIKSFLSPRRRTFDHPEFNNKLKEIYNNVDGIELTEGTPGHHNYKSYTNTVTFNDVNIIGSISTLENLPEELKEAYVKTNETDAASWIMDNTHKEVALKEGQWSDEAEAFHQWHMAYTRRAFDKKGIKSYSSEALRKHDDKLLASPIPSHKLAVRKPIVSGNKNNKNEIDVVLDKTSQLPLYYHMVEGTSLEQMYIQMFNQNIGYGIVISGRKVGAEKLHEMYIDGKYNNTPFENIIEVPWSSYGTQVETMSEGEKTQTRGSQLTKISSTDLYENGEPISEQAKNAYERNKKALNNLNENAYKELLEKLGVEDLGVEFALIDGTKVSETLMYEMMRRELSENAKDTIQLDSETGEFLIPFEASPSYVQIKNILYALINNSLISPKMNGAPHVQTPVTGFEKFTEGREFAIKTVDGWKKITNTEYAALSEEDKKKAVLTDSTLKFYTPDQPYVEVMLPNWFAKHLKKGKFKDYTDEQLIKYLNTTPDGKKILSGIGFRIPTQALSSAEVFRVKAFLPEYMGYTVVVPSEITTKAGSDFDIDKLNMYLKSIYLDENGEIKLVSYKGSEESTKDFYANVWENTIQKDIDRIEKYDEFRSKTIDILRIIERASLEGISDIETLMTNEQIDFFNYHYTLLQEMIDQAAENNLLPSDYITEQQAQLNETKNKLAIKKLNEQLKSDYVKKMYKKSLENEYYDSLEELLTLPENFNRLISPVNDAGLENISKELDEVRGYNESGIKGRLINRTYMTSLRHAFITGKRWVGIAAGNITNLSLRQKAKVYLDDTKLTTLSPRERQYVEDLNIVLPHNTININGENKVSLSGTKTADGSQFISDRLSGYATSFVDITANPYIAKVIKSDVIVSTFMFLEAIGAGNKGIYFLNQPIIEKYLEYLNSKGSRSVLNNNDISYIKSLFPTTQVELTKASIDTDVLLENIKQYNSDKFDAVKNAEQHLILNEFIKYKILADQLFNYTQATNYDTTRFSSSDSYLKKYYGTVNASNYNLISSVNDVLDNTFIGKLSELLDKSYGALGTILKTENPKIKAYMLSTIKRYATKKYLAMDEFDKISNLIKNSFIDFVIQNNTSIREMIKPLLVDEGTSIVMQLEQLKQKYPKIQILKDLVPVSGNREGGAMSIKLNVNTKDAYDENLYTGMMRELRDSKQKDLQDFYKNLINVAILQGTSQSAISIRNIIPVEDYSKIVSPIINQLQASDYLLAFENAMFERNNFKNPEIFESFSPFITPPKPNSKTGEYNKNAFRTNPLTGEDEMVYFIPQFKPISGANKGILKLNEKYNSFYLSSDFIKIPRISKARDGKMVDLVTKMEVTPRDYAIMKKKGSQSLYDVYYYKKVYTGSKDVFGNPIPLTAYDSYTDSTEHYYKLINVYGDGNRAVEFNTNFTPSVINNGSMTIKEEFTDEAIAKTLNVPYIYEEIVSLPTEVITQSTQVEDKVYEKSERIITRAEVKSNPKTLYLFGDNDQRKGLGGQAKEMRGEPNAVGVSTKKYPSNNELSFKTDNELENNKKIITEDINKAIAEWNTGKYNKVVVPQIGVGLAELPTRAPKTYAFLQQELNRLEQTIFTSITEQVAQPGEQLSMFGDTITLKDGKEYNKSDINSNMLEAMGYTPQEIGRILKSIC